MTDDSGLIFFVVALVVFALAAEIVRRRKIAKVSDRLNLKRVGSTEFKRLLRGHKYVSLNSRFVPISTGEYFCGEHGGLSACVFSVSERTGQYSTKKRLAVIVKDGIPSDCWLTVVPKSFWGEVGDMLGRRKCDRMLPAVLVDKYDVSFEGDNPNYGIITPGFLDYCLQNEGVKLETHGGDLLLTTLLDAIPGNYGIAINQATWVAHLLGGANEFVIGSNCA